MSVAVEKILVIFLIFLFCIAAPAQKQDGGGKEFRLITSVTDGRGRYASRLKVEDVQVIVDKKPQEITSFTADNEPATIVFLIDLSGSQKESVKPLAKEIERFISQLNPKNEYIVLAFNTKIQVVIDKIEDPQMLEQALDKTLATVPKGNTAFYDSVYAAIEKAESGKYEKQILIAFSDGNDNESVSYKMNDVADYLKRSSILFYGVSYIKDLSLLNSVGGPVFLTKFSEISGGKSFFPSKREETAIVFERIALELKSQYRISFRVADFTKPDRWRGVKIKIAPVADGNKQVKVQARARSGFYPASAQ